jgi:hypothetical protein
MPNYKDSSGNKQSYGRNKKTGERRNNNNQDEQRKKSGCQQGIGRDSNKAWVSGWNISAQGYMKFLAFPYKDTKRVTSGSGVQWENWVVKITHPDKQQSVLPCLYEVGTGRVLMKDLGMIANPKAPNGGYWGTMFVHK